MEREGQLDDDIQRVASPEAAEISKLKSQLTSAKK